MLELMLELLLSKRSLRPISDDMSTPEFGLGILLSCVFRSRNILLLYLLVHE